MDINNNYEVCTEAAVIVALLNESGYNNCADGYYNYCNAEYQDWDLDDNTLPPCTGIISRTQPYIGGPLTSYQLGGCYNTGGQVYAINLIYSGPYDTYQQAEEAALAAFGEADPMDGLWRWCLNN